MTVFTEGKRPTEGVLSEDSNGLSRDEIVIASGAGIIAPLTVLGKIAASGEYIPSPAAEVSGSKGAEVAVAVNLYAVDATSNAVRVAAITRLAQLNGNYLTYAPSRDQDAERLAARVDLAAKDIIVR